MGNHPELLAFMRDRIQEVLVNGGPPGAVIPREVLRHHLAEVLHRLASERKYNRVTRQRARTLCGDDALFQEQEGAGSLRPDRQELVEMLRANDERRTMVLAQSWMRTGYEALGTAMGSPIASLGALSPLRSLWEEATGGPKFRLVELGGRGLHTMIWIPGFLNEAHDPEQHWGDVVRVYPNVEHLALVWQAGSLPKLVAPPRVLKTWQRSALAGAGSALFPPMAPFLAIYAATTGLRDITVGANAWEEAITFASMSGLILAMLLQLTPRGFATVSVGGFSLGARVAADCATRLEASQQCDEMILLGAAMSVSAARRAAQTVPRTVHCYATEDMALRTLYDSLEADKGGPAAGHSPLPDGAVVNVDVGDLVGGHMGYTPFMGAVLARASRREGRRDSGKCQHD